MTYLLRIRLWVQARLAKGLVVATIILADNSSMIINKEFVDKVLSRSTELFKFRGMMKYYPNRELGEENTLVFIKRDHYMDFMWNNLGFNSEFYVINQRRCQISFRFKEEALTYEMREPGKFTLTLYENLKADFSKIQIDRLELIQEIRDFVKNHSSKRNHRQKIS